MSNNDVSILLIEDSPTDARLVKEMLADAGDGLPHNIHRVSRFSEGLEWLENNATDVILLDLSLPDSQGLDTLVRVHERVPNIPIVVLTGFDDESLGIAAMQHGAQDYLVKQRVDTTSLVRSIRYALERQRAETQRVALSIERTRVAALKRFIQDASHDIRTPLTSIVTRTYLLRRELKSRAGVKLEEHLDILDAQTKRLQKILDDMLQMSRLDDTNALIDLVPTDLNQLSETIIEEFKPRAIQKGIDMQFSPAMDLPSVLMDADEFKRALANIVSNSINFTPNGGLVKLCTYTRDDMVIFESTDTGIGISSSNIPRIFERFYRIDQSRAISTGGTGMGLAIAQRLVELHDGIIEVESVPNQGSVFRILLPRITNLST